MGNSISTDPVNPKAPSKCQSQGQLDSNEIRILRKLYRDLTCETMEDGNTQMDKPLFLKYFPLPGLLGERFFAVLNRAGTGVIDFHEFKSGFRILCKGSKEEKFDFVFEMFDLSSSGSISKAELKTMLSHFPNTAFEDLVRHHSLDTASKSRAQIATEIAESVSNPGRPCSRKSFLTWCFATPVMTSFLNNPLGVPPADPVFTRTRTTTRPPWSGILYKQSKRTRRWISRHYVLRDPFLYYYAHEGCHVFKGVIILTDELVVTKAERDGYFGFNLSSRHRHRCGLYAPTRAECERWITRLRVYSSTLRDQYDMMIVSSENLIISGQRSTQVKIARHRVSGARVALKIISKTHLTQAQRACVSRERAILTLVCHPNVLHLRQLVESPTHVTFVTDYIDGGDLFQHQILGRSHSSERDTRAIARPVFQGLAYLHEMGILHRDIKPQNILCGSLVNDMMMRDVRIADFGFSQWTLASEARGERWVPCGTLPYVAPEVLLMQGQGEASDVWSLGVVLFLLLTGTWPFTGQSPDEMLDEITTFEFCPDSMPGRVLSGQAVDLLRGLLVSDPALRRSAASALTHPWFGGKCTSNTTTADNCPTIDNPHSPGMNDPTAQHE